jgi:galactokinase
MSIQQGDLIKHFERVFAHKPTLGSRAPGRVNLIGEHIDYNGGFVLPAAIDREVDMVASPSSDGQFHLYSVGYNQKFSWPERSLPIERSVHGWPNYFVAVVEQLKKKRINVKALNVVIDGDVPTGGGLSSSAAYEVCAAKLILLSTGKDLSGTETALLAQAAEHSRWVGVQCGIMDQFISANGIAGHALRIDCQKLEFKPVSLDGNQARLIVIHSTVARELVQSAYNERRKECENALQLLNELTGTTREFLVEYNQKEITDLFGKLPDPIGRRARHVITEQARVLECEARMDAGDMFSTGRLFNESHSSLRDDYEVSCRELDIIHARVGALEGVYGCRLTGAGFGGCAVALVAADHADRLAGVIPDLLAPKLGAKPWALVTPACAGAEACFIM